MFIRKEFGKSRSNACKFRDNGGVTRKELLEVMQRICAALHLCGRVAEKSRHDAGKVIHSFWVFHFIFTWICVLGLAVIEGRQPTSSSRTRG